MSTVAIGKDADVQLMVDVAKWGRGRFYYTERLADDPAHLHARDPARLQGVARRAAVQAAADRASPRGDAGDRLEGACRRSAATSPRTLKRTAELVLMSHQEDPVLATWRYGLGALGRLHLRRQGASGACSGCAGVTSTSSGRSSSRWTLRSGTRSDTVATSWSAWTTTGEVLRRRRRRQGRVHQLPRLAGRRGGAEPGAVR